MVIKYWRWVEKIKKTKRNEYKIRGKLGYSFQNEYPSVAPERYWKYEVLLLAGMLASGAAGGNARHGEV